MVIPSKSFIFSLEIFSLKNLLEKPQVHGWAARAMLSKAAFERFTQENKDPVLRRKQLADHLAQTFAHLVEEKDDAKGVSSFIPILIQHETDTNTRLN